LLTSWAIHPWLVLLVLGAVAQFGANERVSWSEVQSLARASDVDSARNDSVSGVVVARVEHGMDCPVESEPDEREDSVLRLCCTVPTPIVRPLQRLTTGASLVPRASDDSIRRDPRAPPQR